MTTSEVDPSGTPLSRRLGIGPGTRVALLHAPDGFDGTLGPLPEGAEVRHGLRRSDAVDVVVGFVTERDHLARNLGWIVETLSADGAFWVAWPTPGSGVATDLEADVVREVARGRGLTDDDACALDATWTGLRLVRRSTGPRGSRPGRSA